jgi:histidinol-phosphate aminotransferase
LSSEITKVLATAPEVTSNISRLTPYRHGKSIEEVERELGITGMIKLASNENSLGPSPAAIEAMHKFAAKMNLYPDAGTYDLQQFLAQKLQVDPEGLVFGNGSDDVIHLIGITFLNEGDEVVQAHPSFVRYEAAATLNNCKCHLVPLTSNWVHDLDAMLAAVNEKTRLVFITNPNNPTGTIVGKAALDSFLNALPERVLAVIDEAYYEYAANDPDYPDCLPYVRDGRNVVLLRTFSKAYGLAGLRIGYGITRPEIAGWLNRTREPFNVNLMAQAAAIAAAADSEHVARTVDTNEAGKAQFYAVLDELGLSYAPTYGNFIWFDTGKDSKQVYNKLLYAGVITRTGDIFGAPTYLRVTIGTEQENTKFLNALPQVLADIAE